VHRLTIVHRLDLNPQDERQAESLAPVDNRGREDWPRLAPSHHVKLDKADTLACPSHFDKAYVNCAGSCDDNRETLSHCSELERLAISRPLYGEPDESDITSRRIDYG